MQKALEIAIILAAVDRMTAVVNKAVGNVVTKLQGVQKRADAVAKTAFATGRDLGAMGLAAGAALAYPIKAAADFETGMANVRKVVDGLNDAKSIADMGRDIRVLSRELPIAQSELLDLVAAGGRMGVPKAELLDYTRLVAKMATAFDSPAAEIGEQMGRLATVFKIPINNVGALADAVNYLDDNAISKGADIMDVMRRVGGTAQQVGLAAPKVAALASTFLTLGNTVETAATASNAIIRELSIATIQPGRFQEGLSKLGISAAAIQKSMTVDPQNTILGVLEKINALPKSKQIEVTTQLFGKEYGDDVAKLSQGINEYRRQLGLLNDPKLNGSVQREFAIRSQTANAQAQLLKNNLNEVAVVAGNALLPVLNRIIVAVRPILERLTAWIERNQELTAKIGMVIGGFAAFSLAAAGVSFVIGGVAKAISVALTVFSAVVKIGGFLIRVFNGIRIVVAVLGGPVSLAIAAIAVAAFLIYKYWGNIVSFFTRIWTGIKSTFLAGWEWIKGFFLNYTLPGLIIKHWGDLKAVANMFYNAGKNIVTSIWEGIKSLAMKPVEAIKDIVTKVREFLPFSPAKVGPLRDLHRVRIVETIAATMKPGPMVQAMSNVATVTAATGGRRSVGSVSAAAGGITLNFSPTINVGPGSATNRADILDVLRQFQPEILRLIEDAMDRKNRARF